MTDGHVIPRAAGGRLSAPFECAQCNGRLGSSVEARLVSDPAMRLAVEALGDRLRSAGHPSAPAPALRQHRRRRGGPRGFVWTKTADQILESIARYCNRINASGH
jgi:hypothetical protein